MTRLLRPLLALALSLAIAPSCSSGTDDDDAAAATTSTAPVTSTADPAPTVPVDDTLGNVYAHAGADGLSAVVAGDLPRVYVPNGGAGTVSVIDPATFTVVS